ncbi:MAG: IPTL-CTERM sorting domain-containing protein [Rudaea sp.]
MTNSRSYCIKPLAAALAIALGAAGMTADAGASGNPAFAARMQHFHTTVTQLKQYRAQHPGKLALFPHSHPHKLNRPQLLPAAPVPTKTVTSCVDTASSGTTAGTLRYEVINAVANDVIDLSACNNSTITLTQGALPVTVGGLTLTAGAPTNHVTIDGNGADRVFYDTFNAGPNGLTLKYLTVQNGVAPQSYNGNPVAIGGCILAPNAGVALYQSTVTGCTATNPTGNAYGGGVAAAALYMYQSKISGNTVSAGNGTASSAAAVGGGAIAKYASITLYSQITGNTATSNAGVFADGGGLWSGQPYLIYTTIANNKAHMIAGSGNGQPYIGIGGGLTAKYGAKLQASTISGNSATCTSSGQYNTFCIGGGVAGGYAPGNGGGSLNVYYSTISGNHSDFLAGGILSKYQLNLVQSTVSGNSASAGGALVQKYLSGSGYGVSAYNSTIAGNSATYYGGGVYDYSGGGGPFAATPAPITLTSSIVAKNTSSYPGSDIYVPSAYTLTISGSNDLVMAASSNITLPGGTLSADPMLAPLANNGGPTRTMGLLAGSPALDAGSNPNNYTNDQRGNGFPRVVGALPDIGAFEGIVAPVAVPVPSPTLSVWALGLLAALLGWLGWRRARVVPQRE